MSIYRSYVFVLGCLDCIGEGECLAVVLRTGARLLLLNRHGEETREQTAWGGWVDAETAG